MATGATYSVKYRRKREQKTNYKKRLNLLKSRTTRFVVRPSNKHMIAQLVDYNEDGDKVIAHATSAELIKMGWKHSTSNTPAAYLTGLMCGVRGKAKGVEKAILDTGLFPQAKSSRIYATLKGLTDAGIAAPANEEIFPSPERLSGKTLSAFVEKSKDIEKDYASMKQNILKPSK